MEPSDDLVSKSDFAKRVGVTPGRVSQLISSGQIGGAAIAGTGRHARIRAGVALAMLRGSLDLSHGASSANLSSSGGDDTSRKFQAAADAQKLRGAIAKTRSADVLREINEIKLLRLQGELIPREASLEAHKALWRAVAKAHTAIAAWGEELYAAGQVGGLGALCAALRAKGAELSNSVADMIMAEVAKLESDREGAVNG